MITVIFALMVIILAGMNLYLVDRIRTDIGKVEDHEEEIAAVFVGLTRAGEQLRDMELRITKAEQIAANAQNKATANQRRIEKAVICDD